MNDTCDGINLTTSPN